MRPAPPPEALLPAPRRADPDATVMVLSGLVLLLVVFLGVAIGLVVWQGKRMAELKRTLPMEAQQERERYVQFRAQLDAELRQQEMARQQQEKATRLAMHASRVLGSPSSPFLMLALLQIDPEHPPEDLPGILEPLPDVPPDERPPGGQP